jgi:hypothetical protein
MGKKEKVPAGPRGEMDPVSEEQEQKITAFIDKVWEPMKAAWFVHRAARAVDPNVTADFSTMLVPSMAELNDTDRRIMVYKFLTARQYDAKKAEDMLKATCKFKHERRLDEDPTFPAAFAIRGWDQDELSRHFCEKAPRDTNSEIDVVFRHITPSYQASYHKWDKHGHPVLIEATGKINVVGLVDKLKQLCKVNEAPNVPILNFHIHVNEVGGRLVRYQDHLAQKERGERVLGVVAIIDAYGFTMGHLYKPALDVLKHTWAVDAEHYPEGLHGVYVANAPTFISFVWNVVKGWLDPRVRTKVKFLKPHHTAEGLLEVIDAENLPAFLGGNCQCEGGCVYGRDSAAELPEEDPSQLSELFHVGSGKKVQKEVRGELEDVIVWEFTVSDERNIEFSAIFVADGEEEAQGREVYLAEKTQTMDVRHVCTEKGRLILSFSNEYSWVRGKDVTLRLFITK